MTPEGSAACAAAGVRNMARLRAGEKPMPSAVERKVAAFRELLETQSAAIPEPGRSALIASACANYAAVLLGEAKLLRLSRRPHKLDDIVANLAPHSSNLLRALRALRLVGFEADPDADAPPANATPEELREWSRAYVEKRHAEARGEAQP